jgi:organic hydroperoxide reductase OsmC/OhrA
MPTPVPHRYKVSLVQEGDHAVLSSGERPIVIGGPPPEFDGSGAWWSPEHLLVSSAALCFMATFRALARHSHVSVEAFESEAEGVLDRRDKEFAFVSIELHVTVRVGPGQTELAERLIQSAKRHCIVANSLKTPVDVVARVSAEEALPA